MALRLVVCVHFRPPPAEVEGDASETWSGVARSLLERATALGGRVVGWRPRSLSVDFALDGLQDAVDFLVDEPLGSSLASGVALGELEECLESHRVALCSGEVLERAEALAAYARPGEVLVSPELVEAARGELLTRGPAKKREGREAVPAFVLDVVHPLRSLLVEAVAGLGDAPWLGEDPAPFAPAAGRITVLRAPAGAGGSRWLEQLAAARADALRVRPGRTGWPGSALAQALGVPLEATMAELRTALEDAAPSLVLVDDADVMDPESLAGLAEGCRAGRFGLVVRLLPEEGAAQSLGGPQGEKGRDRGRGLAALFEEGRVSTEVTLRPWSGAQAAELARALTQGRLDAQELGAIEELGEQTPLEVAERIACALDGGDWVALGDTIQRRATSTPERLSAAEGFSARFERLPFRLRSVLEALAVLGGLAEPMATTRLLEPVFAASVAAGEPTEYQAPLTADEVEASLGELVAARWLTGPPHRLASATARRAILAQLPTVRARRLHAAAARVAQRSGTWGGRAAAVVHAIHAGRRAQARDLARSAAEVVAAAGAESTAAALIEFAERGVPSATWMRGTEGFPDQAADGSGEGVPEVNLVSRSPVPPPVAPAVEISTLEGATDASLDAPRASEGAEAFGLEPLTSESDSVFPQRVADALARRDPTLLLEMAATCRARQQSAFAERLDALACLVRGESGEALARLRRARAVARESAPSEQCRAELALAIGLAACGRGHEAFLGALAGLARAREASDARGERACARFLAELARRLGSEQDAQRWQSLCP